MAKHQLPKEYLKNGGPGRPKGSVSGRSQALAVLDEVCGDTKIKEVMRKELMAKAMANPVGFFMKIVVPLIPKEAVINMNLHEDTNNAILETLSELTTKDLEKLAYPDKAGASRPSKVGKDRSGS
jgi:hypothetical protein